MSNAWRDDRFFDQAWVRAAGPIAACLYQAAEDYCHRNLTNATVPLRELAIILPWAMRPGELDGAIEILERLGRFERTLDAVKLPQYFVEQEADEAQESRRAKAVRAGRARAASGQRDTSGKLVAASSELDSSKSQPASYPIRSYPIPISPPPSASDAAPPRGNEDESSPKPRRPPPNDGARLGEAFREAYIARFSAEPEIQKQHYVRASAHTKRVGLDEALRRLAIYLDDEKCPYGKRGQKAFGTFLAVFDECAAPRANGRPDVSARPPGDPGYVFVETPSIPKGLYQ